MKDELYRTYKLPDKPCHSDSDGGDYEELQLPKELQGNFNNAQSSLSKPFTSADDMEDDDELGDPEHFSQKGDFLKSMLKKTQTFLTNQPDENILLSSLLLKILNNPVKIDELDGQFKSKTDSMNETHEKITMLHMFLFDIPLKLFSNGEPDFFSILAQLHTLSLKITELLQDKKVQVLVDEARFRGDIQDMTLGKSDDIFWQDPSLINVFDQYRRTIFNIVIF